MNLLRSAALRPLSVPALAALLASSAPAQGPAPAPEAPRAKPDEFPSFESVVEGLTKVVSTADGSAPLYELHADKKTGRLVAVLPAGFEKQELMIACTITGGDPEAGVMGPTHYGKWRRIGKSLAFVVPNVNVRSEGDERAQAAVASLYGDTLLVSVPILALEGGARPAIDLGKLAVGEVQKLFGAGGGYGPSITALQAPLATLTKAKAFPENVVVEYEAPETGGRLVRVAYSIGKLEGTPGFQPREADPRVGYFYDWHVDTAAGEFEAEPKRYINRWHVEKADPALSLSPPKQPIVWYVEHTTPIKYRRWVKDGILLWNQAFEKIGIAGALEVYQQDAATGAHMDKDPEDARYNFFRWNMSAAGYAIGPSRSNPRTGEILEADVVWNQGLTRAVGSMLGSLSRTMLAETSGPELLAWLDQHPSWDPRARFDAFDGALGLAPVAPAARPPSFLEAFGARNSACHMGSQLSVDLALAGAAFEAGLIELESESQLDGVPEEFLGPMIRYISAHEVGHCLGLQHNMAASTRTSIADMNAPGFAGQVTASVMDYVAPNLATSGHQGPFINSALGSYDHWAIACGYGPEKDLKDTLAKSSEVDHLYVSQIAMSSSSDPRNQTWDVGADNLEYCEERMKLVSELRAKLVSELLADGESYAKVRRRYQQLLGTQMRTLVIAAAYVGGAYESHDAKGTPNARTPLVDVSSADQRRALALLLANAFDEQAFGLTPELVRHMGKEYWWDPEGQAELMQDTSYSVHDLVGGFQAMGLALLLNPVRLRRVHDAEFRTAGAADAFTLVELMQGVTGAVWKGVVEGDGTSGKPRAVESSSKKDGAALSSFRRNLQWEHASRLIDLVLVGDTRGPATRAIATLAAGELRRIDAGLGRVQGKLDPASEAHVADLRARIGKALEAPYVRKG